VTADQVDGVGVLGVLTGGLREPAATPGAGQFPVAAEGEHDGLLLLVPLDLRPEADHLAGVVLDEGVRGFPAVEALQAVPEAFGRLYPSPVLR
jgi:hypothetical protein